MICSVGTGDIGAIDGTGVMGGTGDIGATDGTEVTGNTGLADTAVGQGWYCMIGPGRVARV